MDLKITFLLVFVFVLANGLPTMYKMNENRVLEKDLVPVSSTVIPLPIYRVSSGGYNIKPTKEEELNQKPTGPISLITVNSKKRLIPQEKKLNLKQVYKKDFES